MEKSPFICLSRDVEGVKKGDMAQSVLKRGRRRRRRRRTLELFTTEERERERGRG